VTSRWTRRGRLTVAAVVAVLVGVGAAWWCVAHRQAAQPHPVLRLQMKEGETVQERTLGWRADEPASIGAMTVCLSSPGTARITGIDPIAPIGGMHVIDWGVRPNPSARHLFQLGGPFPAYLNEVHDKGGADSGWFDIRGAVTAVCGGPEAGDELGITYMKPTDVDGATGGLVIHYEAGGGTGTVTVPIDEVMCGTSPHADAQLTSVCPRPSTQTS
jgi:hypothetical protein